MKDSSAVPTEWARPAAGARPAIRALQDAAVIVAAGVACALTGQLLGRLMHAVWAVPTAGSVAVALPRAVILLAVAVRVRRFGALTAAGVAEVATRLATGAVGLMPWFLIVPIAGNLLGDLVLAGTARLGARRVRLMLGGAVLNVGRVVMAWGFWSLTAAWPRTRSATPLLWALSAVFALNVLAGVLAGVGVSAVPPRAAKAGKS